MPFKIVDCRRIQVDKSPEDDCAEPYLVRFDDGRFAKVWQEEPNEWEDYWCLAFLEGHPDNWLEEDYDRDHEDYFPRREEEAVGATLARVFARFNVER